MSWAKRFYLNSKFSLWFSVFLFFFHLIVTVKLLSFGSQYNKNLENSFAIIWPQVFSFEVRVLLLFFFYYLANAIIECLLGFKKGALIIVSVFFYLQTYSFLKYPGLFDDLRLLAYNPPNVYPLVKEFLFPAVSLILPGLFLAMAVRCRWRERSVLLGLVFLIGILVVLVYRPYLSRAKDSVDFALTTTEPMKSVVLLSVDSLRPKDERIEEFLNSIDSQKSRILFQNSVAPIPLTHASLASLFSEKMPQEIGLRNYLEASALTDPEYYVGPTLRKLHGLNYNIAFLIDGQAFILFEKNKYIDFLQTPEQGFATFLAPQMLRSGVYFSIFNNVFGEMLFPEMVFNSEFFATFDLRKFSGKVEDLLESLQNQKRPYFLFVHSCVLHWPGGAHHPFAESHHLSAPFYSYDSRYLPMAYLDRRSPKEWLSRASVNKEIYSDTIRWVIEDYLRPLLKKINSLDQVPITILQSDHGEDFWIQDKYPLSREVTHTRSGLFSSRSEFFTLEFLTYPKAAETSLRRLANKAIGSYDIMPLVEQLILGAEPFNYVPKSEYVYSESGPWSSYWAPGLFTKASFDSLERGMLFGQNTHLYAHYDQSIMNLSKVRTVTDGVLRLSVYPTDYGFYYFVCGLSSDPNCTTNLAGRDPKTEQKMLNALNEFSALDIKKGEFPFLTMDSQTAGSLSFRLGEHASEWLRLLSAYEKFYRYGDVRESAQILDRLEGQVIFSEDFKRAKFDLALELCKSANEIDFIDFGAESLETLSDFLSYFGSLKGVPLWKLAACYFRKGSDSEKMDLIESLFRHQEENTKDTISADLAVALISNNQDVLTKFRSQTDLSEKNFNSLNTYSVYRARDDLDSLLRLFDNPEFTKLSPSMEAFVSKSRMDQSYDWRERLEEEFRIDFNYHFYTALEEYYKIKYKKLIDDNNLIEVLRGVGESATPPFQFVFYLSSKVSSRQMSATSPRDLFAVDSVEFKDLDRVQLVYAYCRFLILGSGEPRRLFEFFKTNKLSEGVLPEDLRVELKKSFQRPE